MAVPLTLALVAALGGLTFLFRASGPVMTRVPPFLSRRTAGLAPALLAALVALQLTSARGIPTIDARVLAVLVAIILSAFRVPFVFVVGAGAMVAALARLIVHA